MPLTLSVQAGFQVWFSCQTCNPLRWVYLRSGKVGISSLPVSHVRVPAGAGALHLACSLFIRETLQNEVIVSWNKGADPWNGPRQRRPANAFEGTWGNILVFSLWMDPRPLQWESNFDDGSMVSQSILDWPMTKDAGPSDRQYLATGNNNCFCCMSISTVGYQYPYQ